MPGTRDLAFLSALADLLRARGVTTLFTQDIPRIGGVNFDLPMGEVHISGEGLRIGDAFDQKLLLTGFSWPWTPPEP